MAGISHNHLLNSCAAAYHYTFIAQKLRRKLIANVCTSQEVNKQKELAWVKTLSQLHLAVVPPQSRNDENIDHNISSA